MLAPARRVGIRVGRVGRSHLTPAGRFVRLVPLFVELYDLFQDIARDAVLLAPLLGDDRIALGQQRFGLVVAAQRCQTRSEPAVDLRNTPVSFRNMRAADGEAVVQHRQSRLAIAAQLVHLGQIIENDADPEVIVAERLAIDIRGLEKERLCLLVVAGLSRGRGAKIW